MVYCVNDVQFKLNILHVLNKKCNCSLIRGILHVCSHMYTSKPLYTLQIL